MEQKEIRIDWIKANSEKKDGTPYIDKYGNPSKHVTIKTGQHFLSGWENDETRTWKAGDIVKLMVEKKGEYINFKTIQQPNQKPKTYPSHGAFAQSNSSNELKTILEDIKKEIVTGFTLMVKLLIKDDSAKEAKQPIATASSPDDLSSLDETIETQPVQVEDFTRENEDIPF